MRRTLTLVMLLLFTGCASSYQPPRSSPSWAYRGVSKGTGYILLVYASSREACQRQRDTEGDSKEYYVDGLSKECLPVTITPGSGDTGWFAFSSMGDAGYGAALSGPAATCERVRHIAGKLYAVSMCAPVVVREGAR